MKDMLSKIFSTIGKAIKAVWNAVLGIAFAVLIVCIILNSFGCQIGSPSEYYGDDDFYDVERY